MSTGKVGNSAKIIFVSSIPLVPFNPRMADYEVTQQVFEKLVEEKTFDPLFVTHCPKELVPLAKQNV